MSLKDEINPKGRYQELDALRGIAALLVVLFHFTMFRPQAELGFFLGVTGVDLFFIISGFVIFMSVNNINSAAEFAVNRFTRLFPTYWTCLTITTLLYFVAQQYFNSTETVSLTQYLGNLTMFQYYMGIPDIDGPYWSLLSEMLFYILIIIIFISKGMKYIIPIGLFLLYLIYINDFVATTPLQPYYATLRITVRLLYHFPLFFAGIIFYKIVTSESREHRFLYYALLVWTYSLQAFGDNAGAFLSHSQYMLMGLAYYILFILFVNNKLRFIVSRPLLFLGRISYALYLIHQFLGTRILLPYFADTLKLNSWLALLITLTIVILLATLITNYIEIPAGKKLNKVMRRWFKLPLKHEPVKVPVQQSISL